MKILCVDGYMLNINNILVIKSLGEINGINSWDIFFKHEIDGKKKILINSYKIIDIERDQLKCSHINGKFINDNIRICNDCNTYDKYIFK
jgi:Zn finger protein HypA/HybF involved in hydrogenase expression